MTEAIASFTRSPSRLPSPLFPLDRVTSSPPPPPPLWGQRALADTRQVLSNDVGVCAPASTFSKREGITNEGV